MVMGDQTTVGEMNTHITKILDSSSSVANVRSVSLDFFRRLHRC